MGQIILLNGCSSAGKTTLAIKLQQLLQAPYQHMALDQFRVD
jgi:chloramphenicol 3-O-phosphotransferase